MHLRLNILSRCCPVDQEFPMVMCFKHNISCKCLIGVYETHAPYTANLCVFYLVLCFSIECNVILFLALRELIHSEKGICRFQIARHVSFDILNICIMSQSLFILEAAFNRLPFIFSNNGSLASITTTFQSVSS